jgi:hypothetical protein
MTQDELLLLGRGRVPAQPIIAAITRYAVENGEPRNDNLDLQPLIVVAERAGVPYSTLCTWVEGPRRAGAMPFNVADELLCACDLYHLWWGELGEYYERVDLSWKQCECEGCETWFQLKKDTLGRHASQMYCSQQCRQAAHKLRTGRNQHRLAKANRRKKGGRPVGVEERKCRNGHEFTPENTMILKSGKRRCRTCNNATSSAGYHRRRQPVAA